MHIHDQRIQDMDDGANPRVKWMRLLWVWIVLAIGYNLASFVMIQSGGQALSATDPVPASILFIVYAGIVFLAQKGFSKTFLVTNLIFLPMIVYNGILLHIFNFTGDEMHHYSSTGAWFFAIATNFFGVVVGTVCTFKSLNIFSRRQR